MRGWIVLFCFVAFSDLGTALVINEVMYNPNGTDESHEWIELHNNDTIVINLENWSLFENNAAHAFTLFQGSFNLQSTDFAILADNAEQFLHDYPGFLGNLYDTTWSALSNTGESLSIQNENNEIMDLVNYTPEYGNGNGRSSERFYYGWNESNSFGGSPGRENNATLDVLEGPMGKGISLTNNLGQILYLDVLYDSLFAIENLDHISGFTDNISLSLIYSITLNGTLIKNESIIIEGLNQRKTSGTGSFLPNQSGIYTIHGTIANMSVIDPELSDNSVMNTVTVEDTSLLPCNISLSVFVNDTFYEAGESIEFDFSTNDSFPFTIEYWIEDLFGSSYKNKVNTTNLNEKSWKTNIAEQDRALFIKANLFPSCHDVSLGDNSLDYLFIVANSQITDSPKASQGISVLEITDVEDAIFGESVEVKVSIFKGDTRKYSISLWIEDNGKKVSEVTKLKMPDKFSSFEGTLPIQLFDNCERDLEDGRYEVVIDGLGLEDEEKIDIDIRDCDSAGTTSSNQQKLIFAVLNTTIENSNVKATVLLKNSQNTELDIDLWSYVYRGSKSYSGEREANRESFVLGSHEEKIITLQNTASINEPGTYKFKVLLNKNNQKTNQDITRDIEFTEQHTASFEQTKTTPATQKPIMASMAALSTPITQSAIVYESNTQRAKNTIFMFILAASILLNLIFFFRL